MCLSCAVSSSTRMDEEYFLVDKQRKCFLEMESTPGEDAVRIVERTIKD